VVWVNEWFAPPKESEAANSLINGGGRDVPEHQLSRRAEDGRRARCSAFGKDGDMSGFAPKAHLGSAVIDWTPYYSKVVEDTLAGKWQTGNFWWGVKEGAIDLKKIADDVPQEIKDKVEKARAGLKDGSFAVWTGPIKDNTGKELLEAGKVPMTPGCAASTSM
jgi:simple sugar transport system substrate-binding protein